MNAIKLKIPISCPELKPFAEDICQHISDTTAIMPVALRDYTIFQLINIINSQILGKVVKAVITFDLEIINRSIEAMAYTPYTTSGSVSNYGSHDRYHAEVLLK